MRSFYLLEIVDVRKRDFPYFELVFYDEMLISHLGFPLVAWVMGGLVGVVSFTWLNA